MGSTSIKRVIMELKNRLKIGQHYLEIRNPKLTNLKHETSNLK